MSKPSWLETGTDVEIKREKSVFSGPLRFWLEKGEEKKIVFLDSLQSIPSIYEHSFRWGKRYGATLTCLKMMGLDCPFCEFADEKDDYQLRRYHCTPLTIIDLSTYTDKQGKKHVNVKKLFPAKESTRELIIRAGKKLQDQGKDLHLATFEVFRPNKDKSIRVGENFTYVEHQPKDFVEDISVLDPEKAYAPDPDMVYRVVKALRSQAGMSPGNMPDASDDSESNSDTDDVNIDYD